MIYLCVIKDVEDFGRSSVWVPVTYLSDIDICGFAKGDSMTTTV
jgi:hypothetical protein